MGLVLASLVHWAGWVVQAILDRMAELACQATLAMRVGLAVALARWAGQVGQAMLG